MQAIAVPNGQGVLPSASDVENARTSLIASLPDRGFGDEKVREHINGELVPGLNRSSKSPNYYGFVIGGATPVAAFADNVVTEHDQNVHVHLPKEVITTDVEDRALTMVCELLDLKPSEWPHRTFSTGATASNTIGLACGREHVVAEAARRIGRSASVAEDGILEAMRTAELDYLQILTTVPHSSLRKSASVVGLGRAYVKDVGQSKATHLFDMSALEALMSEARTASIVAISYSDVNTGLFATDGQTMHDVRRLCDKYGAWIHVDAAFGLLARCLPQQHDYSVLLNGVAGLELADSITGDAHKMINVVSLIGIALSSSTLALAISLSILMTHWDIDHAPGDCCVRCLTYSNPASWLHTNLCSLTTAAYSSLAISTPASKSSTTLTQPTSTQRPLSAPPPRTGQYPHQSTSGLRTRAVSEPYQSTPH